MFCLAYLQKLYKTTLVLAYQSFGVVYGDLCTSPIYVYKSTFSGSLSLYEEEHEIFGVFSLVFWTLTIIPLCKYIIFVLGADDNGEGAHVNPPTIYCFKHLINATDWVLIFSGSRADICFAGGTFALYSLLCRHSKMGLLKTDYVAHQCVSSNNSTATTEQTRTSLLIKEFFEKHRSSRVVLLLLVLLGTSMVIGDGILTPTMSGIRLWVTLIISQ